MTNTAVKKKSLLLSTNKQGTILQQSLKKLKDKLRKLPGWENKSLKLNNNNL